MSLINQTKSGIKKLIQGTDIFSTIISYSGSGEDIQARYIFNQQKKGFYVDIGAFNPKILSNTYLLYRQGWTGINVEPIEENYKKFLKIRKKDININCALGSKNGKGNFYSYKTNKGVENATASLIKKSTGKKYDNISRVDILTLESLFDKYLPKKQEIDFMDLDVEGMDLVVLKSNNWKKYRPKVILVEESITGPLKKFLGSVGYERVFILPCSSFYFEKNYYKKSRFYNKNR